MSNLPKYPMVYKCWAERILPNDLEGLQKGIIFEKELPKEPKTKATYTFVDEEGNILPHPSPYDRNPPPYCFVQYVENLPPPPPMGYRYIWSELQRDMSSPEFHFYHEIGVPRYGIDTPNVSEFVPYALTLAERSGMQSSLIEHPEGYFSPEAGALVSNFTIKPHRLIRVNSSNGCVVERLEYSVQAQNERITAMAECDVGELDKLPENIKNTVTGTLMNPKISKVDAMIAFHLRGLLLRLPRVDKYVTSGWNRINGAWAYVQDNHYASNDSLIFETGFHIARNLALSNRDAMYSAMGMLAVGNQLPAILPLVLYAHLGVLYTLFEEAGFPPRMLLFVNGKTGSLKTALCSVLFNLTGDRKKNIPATFRDTVASVEAKFPEFTDKVLLLDDFSPATTARNKADMNKLLEDVIRYYGDGKGRGRSNVSVTKSVTPIPRGLCCITGEDTGGSQSSLLRCLLIDVSNGTFDGERLAPYQKDPSLWTTHFNYFIEYVAARFDLIVEEIRSQFPKLRSELRNTLSAGRTIDSAILLCMTARILLEYGSYIGWNSQSGVQQTYGLWYSAIVEAARKSETISAEQDPVKFCVSTLFEAVDSGAEIIAPDKESFLKDTSVLGYEKGNTWHVWPERLYALLVKRSQMQRKMYPLSSHKLAAALYDANLVIAPEAPKEGGRKPDYRYRESFGNRPRMLVIIKDAAQKYLEV